MSDRDPPWSRPSMPRTLQAAQAVTELAGAAGGRARAHALLAEMGAPAPVLEASRVGLLNVIPAARDALMVLDRVLRDGELPRPLDPAEMLPPGERGILSRMGLARPHKPSNPHFSSALEALTDGRAVGESPGRYGFARKDGKR